ncbi:MAG: hypothetical protein ACRECH_16830 [Nitrososphaerales archaeon]
MKKFTFWLTPLVALVCFTSVQAASMDKDNVSRVYTDIVAPADQMAYEAGVKAYNQCLGQHGFKYTWTALNHETGNTYAYSYVSAPTTWAAFDDMRTSGKACDSVFQSATNPHLRSETSSFLVRMPELSHMSMDLSSGLVGVIFYTLKHGHAANEAFTNAAKMFAAAAAKTKWPYPYMLSRVEQGDAGAPDFILSYPAKNWADYGEDLNPSFMKMLENAYGKKKATELLKSFNDAVQDTSSHLDSVNTDLTYTPSGK